MKIITSSGLRDENLQHFQLKCWRQIIELERKEQNHYANNRSFQRKDLSYNRRNRQLWFNGFEAFFNDGYWRDPYHKPRREEAGLDETYIAGQLSGTLWQGPVLCTTLGPDPIKKMLRLLHQYHEEG